MDHLGTDGTSSDEEDPAHPGAYVISRKAELSAPLVELKR